eukprot:Hpha_TRINITY_DN30223_c0_g1::TRINITY_DN30223_c0_g1_i1::g.27175::m.27175
MVWKPTVLAVAAAAVVLFMCSNVVGVGSRVAVLASCLGMTALAQIRRRRRLEETPPKKDVERSSVLDSPTNRRSEIRQRANSPPLLRGHRVRSPHDDQSCATSLSASGTVSPRKRRRPPGGWAEGAGPTGGGIVNLPADVDWPPPSFRDESGRQIVSGIHTLTEEQADKRDETMLQAKQAGLVPVEDAHKLTDEDFLTRFLIARKFDAERALKMIEFSCGERLRLGLDPPQLYRSAMKAVRDDIAELYPVYFYGKDKAGYPVYWSRPDPAQYRKLTQTYETETIIFWMFVIVERGRELCKRLGKDRWTAVTDLSQVSLGSVLRGPVSALLKEQMKRVQEVYPEMIRMSLLINPPTSFSAIYALARPLLDQRVLDKMKLGCKLSDFVDPADTPEQYGGTAQVDPMKCIIKPADSGLLDLQVLGMQ